MEQRKNKHREEEKVHFTLLDNCTTVLKTSVLPSQLSFILNMYVGYTSCHLSTTLGLSELKSWLLSYGLLIKMLELRKPRNSIPVASKLSPRANPRFHSRKSYELPLLLDAICTADFLTIVGAQPKLRDRTCF